MKLYPYNKIEPIMLPEFKMRRDFFMQLKSSETAHFIGSGPTAFVTVARDVKRVLQRELERARGDVAGLKNCNILIIESKIPLILIKDVISLQCDAETVFEKSLVELDVHIGC